MNFEIIWSKNVLNGLKKLNSKNEPIHFVAHEFFDALPSFKFKYTNGFWLEKLI